MAVEIRETVDGNLAGIIENSSQYPYAVFFLQTDSAAYSLSSRMRIERPDSIYLEQGCIYVESSEKNVIFYLEGHPMCTFDSLSYAAYQGWGLSISFDSTVYASFATTNTIFDFPGIDAISCKCEGIFNDDSHCDSGGYGAASCSISSGDESCSVECVASYACCVQ